MEKSKHRKHRGEHCKKVKPKHTFQTVLLWWGQPWGKHLFFWGGGAASKKKYVGGYAIQQNMRDLLVYQIYSGSLSSEMGMFMDIGVKHSVG